MEAYVMWRKSLSPDIVDVNKMQAYFDSFKGLYALTKHNDPLSVCLSLSLSLSLSIESNRFPTFFNVKSFVYFNDI